MSQEIASSSSKTRRRVTQFLRYFPEAAQELRKVSWPSRTETWRKSWVVVGFSLAFALFLGAMDYLLNTLLKIIL